MIHSTLALAKTLVATTENYAPLCLEQGWRNGKITRPHHFGPGFNPGHCDMMGGLQAVVDSRLAQMVNFRECPAFLSKKKTLPNFNSI